MSYYEQVENANKVIADAENGAYDTQLGITPEHRALITKAHGDGFLTVAEFQALVAFGDVELADSVHVAGRITTPTTNGDTA